MLIGLDRRQLNHVIFALRFLQSQVEVDAEVEDILAESELIKGEDVDPMSMEEIDELCEHVNTSNFGRLYKGGSMFLRNAIGDAKGSDGEHDYELSTVTFGDNPLIGSKYSGCYWGPSWEDLVLMARAAGVDDNNWAPGDKVRWTDPDEGKASDDGVIESVQHQEMDAVITVKLKSGSVVEALPRELRFYCKKEK